MPPRVDEVLKLSDGRRLGYVEWGPADGRVVLQFHGSPAGRLDRWGDEAVLDRLGVRLVTTDRPGIGRSDRRRGRSVADWSGDVRELADHLGAERFPVVGFSMGAAYAGACGALLPDRVAAVGLVSPIGRADVDGVDGMSVGRFLKLARRAPWAMRAIYTSLGAMARRDPAKAHERFWAGASRADRDVVDRPEVRERYWPALIDALGGRARGLVDEMRIAQRPWGYDPAAITAPVHVFHGTKDRVSPPDNARRWAEALPHAEVHWYEGEGHFMIEDRLEEILGAVLAAERAPSRSAVPS